MQENACSLTVLFDAPFWVGIYERMSGGQLEACRIVFGAEPKDYEVYDFLLKNWHRLRFSPPVSAPPPESRRPNPKRMQRAIRSQLQTGAAGTKAQQALQLQREQNKTERQRRTRTQREAEARRRFALRQEKKKARHRGR